jgi:hypothetical protein
MARTRFDDSLIYWRVVSIGLATAFASGVMMSLASRVLVVKMDDIGVTETALNALILGGAGLLVGAILWLPLSLLWHVVAIRLRDRIGLYRAAMWTSGAFCVFIFWAVSLVSIDWSLVALRTNAIVLSWGIASSSVAMAMTHWGFRQARAMQ